MCGDVIPGIVAKVLNARPKTKEAGISVCLMFIEVEQGAVVQVCVCVCVCVCARTKESFISVSFHFKMGRKWVELYRVVMCDLHIMSLISSSNFDEMSF